MRANGWPFFLAALVLVLLIVMVWQGSLVSREARGAAVASGGLMAVGATGGGETVLFLIDPAERKIAAYQIFSGSNPLRLIAVRNIRFDFLPDDFNDRMGISVEDIRKIYGDKRSSP